MSAPSSPKLPSAGGAPPLHRLLAGAADAVQAVREGQSLTEWLARCPADLRPGVQALSFTVLRRLGAAQVVRAALAPKNPPPRVDALLVTALALLWPGETAYADHTLVDQAVHAVRQRAPNSAGFVNAVLRRFLRGREALVAAAEADPVARFNHPRWWQDRLHADWPAEWQGLLQANQQKPPMTLRVNPAHDDLEGYLARLREAGIPAHPAGTLFPQAVVLDEPRPVQALPGFDKGHASVQDASAQLAAPLLLGQHRPQDLSRRGLAGTRQRRAGAGRLRRAGRQDRPPAGTRRQPPRSPIARCAGVLPVRPRHPAVAGFRDGDGWPGAAQPR